MKLHFALLFYTLFRISTVYSEELPTTQLDHFEKKIRPVLVQHCYRCHSENAKRVKGGLLLDSKDGTRKGGDSGPSVVPGQPQKSLLLKALRYQEFEMPPSKKLPQRIIDDFRVWIEQGAVDPRIDKVVQTAKSKIDIEAGKKFWAFQPPQKQELPKVNNANWPQQRIDHFILAKLEQANLSPAALAERSAWIRRVTFDLIGLPPTPKEVNDFVNDKSTNAEKAVVERLLASPHFGERWARVWLDVSRYAEDQAHIVGNNKSLFYPNAYLYRNWVIDALNEDMPYDQFVKLQLAADLIESKDSSNQVALGFIGLGPKYYNRGRLEVKAEEWEDRVDVVSRGLLGLTVACARCHDHKYDPIPTEDYYALAGVFAGTQMMNQSLKSKGNTKKPTEAMHIVKEGKPTDLNIFIRGNVKTKGPIVKRHFPQVLCKGTPQPFTQGSGRKELAEAIANRDNPLTARVIVNRVWGQLFGRGIVNTPSNFGSLGERPTHPKLLDDLAVRFMDNGWSLKWLQREIVLSATYRQSSQANENTLTSDPANRLLGRINRRRLPVESWRDALLSVTGELDKKVGGKSIHPMKNQQRRTVYSYISRLELNKLLALFDFPDPNAHAAKRVETTTPLQKMFVLNSPFMVDRAKALTDRIVRELSVKDVSGQVQRMYQLLFARSATDAELRLARSYLRSGSKERLTHYAHILLASNEMLYLD